LEVIKKERDENLDNLRGFAMVWVILIHVLFWGNLFTDGYSYLLKTFLLFEMPLFFFITGASNSISSKSSYWKFIDKRFEHCLIPYWVFALICSVLSIAINVVKNEGVLSSLKILTSWLLPINYQITSISYLTWALWFIPVYLSITLILPLFLKLKNTRLSVVCFVVLVVMFVGSSLMNMGWIQNVFFYSIWTYIGLYYRQLIKARKDKTNNRPALISVLVIIISVGILYGLYRMGFSLNMQHNKFPPNITFFLFSFSAMSLLYIMYPTIERISSCIRQCKWIGMLFKVFCTRSMTVFLYQVFAFNVTLRLINHLSIGNSFLAMSCKAFICFIFTVLICWILGVVFGKIESWSILAHIDRKHKNKKSKIG